MHSDRGRFSTPTLEHVTSRILVGKGAVGPEGRAGAPLGSVALRCLIVYVFINLFYSYHHGDLHLVAKIVKMVSQYGPETLQG